MTQVHQKQEEAESLREEATEIQAVYMLKSLNSLVLPTHEDNQVISNLHKRAQKLVSENRVTNTCKCENKSKFCLLFLLICKSVFLLWKFLSFLSFVLSFLSFVLSFLSFVLSFLFFLSITILIY